MTDLPNESPITVEQDQDEARPWVWFLSADDLAATRQKLATIAARAARKGFAGTIDLHAVSATRTHTPAPGAPPVTIHGFDVTITGEPPKFAGWRLLAAIDKVGDSAVLRYLPGVEQNIPNDTVRPGEATTATPDAHAPKFCSSNTTPPANANRWAAAVSRTSSAGPRFPSS